MGFRVGFRVEGLGFRVEVSVHGPGFSDSFRCWVFPLGSYYSEAKHLVFWMCFEVHGLRALRSEKLTIVVHVHVQIRQVLLASQAALERVIWLRVCKLCKVFVRPSYMPQNSQTRCPKPRLQAKNLNEDVLNQLQSSHPALSSSTSFSLFTKTLAYT